MVSARSSSLWSSLLRKKLSFRFLFLISILLFSFIIPKNSFAYDDGNLSSTSEVTVGNVSESNSLNTTDEVPNTLRTFVQVLMIESLSALSCQLAGTDPTRPNEKCLGVDPKTGQIGFAENGGGLIAVLGTMIDATLVPPASSTQYVAYLQDNFGLVKEAHAQENPCLNNSRGVGFCSILPILDLWVAMRNIVYLILILIFIVIGVGIMLRIHIDPRTVMTVQNQIPKIIGGIIVISFSFAIAGFLIDVMWVTTYLFANVLGSATGLDNQSMTSIVRAANPIEAAQTISSNAGSAGGISDIASKASQALAELVSMAFENQELGVLDDIVHPIVSIIAFIVFFIAIVVALLRLWVSLIITYVNLVLDIIFAPFWIMAGALPGSSLGIGAWFKDMLANLAVFPVAIAFFILANFFVEAFSSNNLPQNTMAPPLLGGTDSSAVAAIIGLGFILMLPNLLTATKGFFKAPKLNFGPIMGPVGVGTGIVGGVPKRFAGGVLNETTRLRYENGHPVEPGGWRRALKVMRGGH